MSNKRKLSFAALLDRHAQVAVHVGLRPIPGQQIILSAPIEALPLVRLICKHAYMAGASLVTPLLTDGECTLARYRHASDASFDIASAWLSDGTAAAFKEGAARIAISGDNPGLLAGQDPSRVSRAAAAAGKASKPAMEYVTTSRVNWSICAYATRSWAKTAFPELSEKAAVAKLWRAIFAASRADAPDPVAAWMEHNAVLKSRVKILNDRNFASLRFRGPGTDLLVGLADGHKWAGGSSTTPGGAQFNANVPTEEVFTTPHSRRVDGWVSSTKPLSLHGNIVEGIRVRFESGKIVEASAAKGESALLNLIKTDEGASHLGEIALVPHSSPISASGLLFFNTLFDENAACHMAVGQSYAKCMHDGVNLSKDDLIARGANQSNVHVDWMIGSGAVDVDGICPDGTVVPVMRGCEWV